MVSGQTCDKEFGSPHANICKKEKTKTNKQNKTELRNQQFFLDLKTEVIELTAAPKLER